MPHGVIPWGSRANVRASCWVCAVAPLKSCNAHIIANEVQREGKKIQCWDIQVIWQQYVKEAQSTQISEKKYGRPHHRVSVIKRILPCKGSY